MQNRTLFSSWRRFFYAFPDSFRIKNSGACLVLLGLLTGQVIAFKTVHAGSFGESHAWENHQLCDVYLSVFSDNRVESPVDIQPAGTPVNLTKNRAQRVRLKTPVPMEGVMLHKKV